MSSNRDARFPSFFLVVTFRLPGWRGAIPLAFPLFAVEDLLESAGYLASALFFVCPGLARRARVDLGGRASACACAPGVSTGNARAKERGSIGFSLSWLFALARLVRTLRHQGRFTLVEVLEGSSGTEMAVRLV